MLLYYQCYCLFSFIYFVILLFLLFYYTCFNCFKWVFFVLSFSIISDGELLCYLLWTVFLYVISFLSYPFIRVALFKTVDTHILEYLLSRSYNKRFLWYNFYDSQLAFKFLWRLHDDTICSYQVHKSCSYRLFILQEFKKNDLKLSCSSSKSRKKRKKKSLCETLA